MPSELSQSFSVTQRQAALKRYEEILAGEAQSCPAELEDLLAILGKSFADAERDEKRVICQRRYAKLLLAGDEASRAEIRKLGAELGKIVGELDSDAAAASEYRQLRENIRSCPGDEDRQKAREAVQRYTQEIERMEAEHRRLNALHIQLEERYLAAVNAVDRINRMRDELPSLFGRLPAISISELNPFRRRRPGDGGV